MIKPKITQQEVNEMLVGWNIANESYIVTVGKRSYRANDQVILAVEAKSYVDGLKVAVMLKGEIRKRLEIRGLVEKEAFQDLVKILKEETEEMKYWKWDNWTWIDKREYIEKRLEEKVKKWCKKWQEMV